MSRHLRRTLPVAICALLAWACTAERFRLPGSAPPDPQPVVRALTEKATAFETADELQLALLCWRAVLAYAPDHSEARANLKRLEDAAERRARASYLKGKQALADDRPEEARRRLLNTLRLAPGFDDARQQLHQLMNPPVFKWYHLRPGESLADLSRKFYGTADGAGIIAFANDLPVNTEVLTPRVLKIPVLAARQPFEAQQSAQDLARAQSLAKAGRHEEVLAITARLLDADPRFSEAVALENQSRFALGQRLFAQGQYIEARDMLKRIRGPHPGLADLQAALTSAMQRQAEIHYREGVKYYLNDELARAVESWRLTLALDPEHQEAAAGIQEAETLLQKLKTVDDE